MSLDNIVVRLNGWHSVTDSSLKTGENCTNTNKFNHDIYIYIKYRGNLISFKKQCTIMQRI